MATIDPSIALQARGVELPNPLAQFAQVQQIRAAQNQNALAQFAMQDRERAFNDQTAMSQAMRDNFDPSTGKIDPNGVANSLFKSGAGHLVQPYQDKRLATEKLQADVNKTSADTGKLKAETSETEFKLFDQKRQKAISDIASLTSPEHALASLQAHAAAGDIPPEQAELIRKTIPTDPAQFPAWQIGMLQRIMKPEQAAGYIAPDANTVATNETSRNNNADTNATSRANNNATVAATVRGQNMTDARQRETNALPRGQVVQTEAGPMVVDQRTGAAVPVTAGGKPVGAPAKPLTEFQGKSAAFGDRATKANAILTEIGDKYDPKLVNSKMAVQDFPLIGGMAGAAVNSSMSDNDQRAEQAQRDFINAVLRQESGAVIGPTEFENAKRQYFPQPGDGKKVIKQKAENRKTAIEGLLRSAGPNAGVGAPAATTGLPDGWTVTEH
jgi:hypothetical protein